MVAVEITDNGVQFDVLANVKVHPAAELFPLLQGAEFTELVNDIREHGLREPIVFTPDGQLLDGRNRYRACKKIRNEEPIRRVEHSEAWAYVISTNMRRRHLTESQRAMIAARIAERAHGHHHPVGLKVSADTSSPSRDLPPSKQEAADLLNVSTGSIGRAKRVLQHGTTALQQAVEAGKVKVTTADRVAREYGTDEQNEFVRRVQNGADPRNIAPPDGEQERRRRARKPTEPEGPPARNNRSARRHQYITVPNVEALLHSLEGLAVVLNTTDGQLDPSITKEEVARLVGDLSEGIRHARRLQKLLNEHKENSTNVLAG